MIPQPPLPRFAERPFREPDFEALVQIERHAGPARWHRSILKQAVSRLELDTRIVTTQAEPDLPIGFAVVEHGDDILYLCNLAVAPDWRRRGVGRFALESLARLASRLNYRCIALDVQEENLAAQLLYRHAGFRAIEVNRNFYPGQDGYHMVKELNPRPEPAPRA